MLRKTIVAGLFVALMPAFAMAAPAATDKTAPAATATATDTATPMKHKTVAKKHKAAQKKSST